MTAICGGGTSSPIGARTDTLVYTSGLAGLLSPAPGFEWMIPLLPFIGVFAADLPSICATDPPAIVVPTAAEVLSILNPFFNITDNAEAVAKVRNILTNIAWYTFCQCDSTATPTRPTAPAAPTNIPTLAPTAGGLQLAIVSNETNTRTKALTAPTGWQSPSFDDSSWVQVVSQPNATSGFAEVVQNGNEPVHQATANLYAGEKIMGPSTSGTSTTDGIFWRMTFNLTAVPTTEPEIFLHWPFGVSGVPSGTVYVNGVAQTVAYNPFNWLGVYKNLVVGKNVIAANVSANWNGGARGFGMAWVWAGGGSVQFPSDPCSGNQVLLAQLLAGMQSLAAAVELVQRQAAPFGYVNGATHAGLSGSGEIAVSGLVGVALDVTTLPASYGVVSGTPDRHYDLGRLTMGTPAGWLATARIEADPTILVPFGAGMMTRVGYTLAPGIVATVTELVHEP